MGYLNNATTVLDAILTKKGRELLARGEQAFNITKFALADDEVDYSLWDVSHPLGTDYYGQIIENLPLLEPTSDPNTVMKYKLVTRDVGTQKMSQVQGMGEGHTVEWNGTSGTPGSIATINVTSTQIPGTTGTTADPGGYAFTILNSSICYLVGNGIDDGTVSGGINYTQSTDSISQTVKSINGSVDIIAKAITEPATEADNPTTTLVCTGLQYGSTASATITVDYIST